MTVDTLDDIISLIQANRRTISGWVGIDCFMLENGEERDFVSPTNKPFCRFTAGQASYRTPGETAPKRKMR